MNYTRKKRKKKKKETKSTLSKELAVPHFPLPRGDFCKAVPVYHVLRQCFNEVVPVFKIIWWLSQTSVPASLR